MMNLYLERKPDGTYYFRQTTIVAKKQVARRISLKTRNPKTAKQLAIQLLARIQMEKIRTFKVEHGPNGEIIKAETDGPEDARALLEYQDKLEKHRALKHQQELELLKMQADFKEKARDKSGDAKTTALYEQLSNLLNKPSESVLDCINAFYDARAKVSVGVMDKYKRVVGAFGVYCESNEITSIAQVDRKLATKYIKHLRNSGMEDKTIKNYFGVLSNFFNTQRRHGETKEANPFAGHEFEDEVEENREPFTIEELDKIFSSSFVKKKEQNLFILLMLLTSTCRPNEVCQLMTADVYPDKTLPINDEHYIINISPDKKLEKTVKNKRSMRHLYLHNMLIQHGFLEYLKNRTKPRLWDLSKPARNNWATFFSNDFTETLRKELGIEKKTLYCMRHTANNTLKQFGVDEKFREEMSGHTPVGMNAKKYVQTFPPSTLRAKTEKYLMFNEVKSLHSKSA